MYRSERVCYNKNIIKVESNNNTVKNKRKNMEKNTIELHVESTYEELKSQVKSTLLLNKWKAEDFIAFFTMLKFALINKFIIYDEARSKSKWVIREMNEREVIIAKKYGKKPSKFSFSSLIR